MTPVGNVTLTLHSGSNYTLDPNTRYVIGYALSGGTGGILFYGFQVSYTLGGVAYTMNIPADTCVLQN